ncbi:MAG: hypothetical protein ACRD0K_22220 [Egibacteraceae bacterium]
MISPGLAPALDEYFYFSRLRIPRGRVDWAATRAHGHTGAPVGRRHGAWPVVLFSPGFMGSRVLYTVLAEELASRGYVCARVDDTRFVLDWLAALPVVLDLSKIGMFGRSSGDFVAGESMYYDERIGAGINMDGQHALRGRRHRRGPAGQGGRAGPRTGRSC